jgi:hypothetical protein
LSYVKTNIFSWLEVVATVGSLEEAVTKQQLRRHRPCICYVAVPNQPTQYHEMLYAGVLEADSRQGEDILLYSKCK